MAEQMGNTLPSEPPPKDLARLVPWLEQLWKALKDMRAKDRDLDRRMSELEAADE
jgi:hypothetical protein